MQLLAVKNSKMADILFFNIVSYMVGLVNVFGGLRQVSFRPPHMCVWGGGGGGVYAHSSSENVSVGISEWMNFAFTSCYLRTDVLEK